MIWMAEAKIKFGITLKLCDGCLRVEHFIVIQIVHNSQHISPGSDTHMIIL
jgi:hypothetical protein